MAARQFKSQKDDVFIQQLTLFVEKNLEMTENKGEALIDGKQCWILEFEDPNFSFINY